MNSRPHRRPGREGGSQLTSSGSDSGGTAYFSLADASGTDGEMQVDVPPEEGKDAQMLSEDHSIEVRTIVINDGPYISNIEVQANSSSLLSVGLASPLESSGETTPTAQNCAVPKEAAGEMTPKAQNLPTNYAGSPPVLPNNYAPLDMLLLTPLSTPQLSRFPTVSPPPPSFISPSTAQPPSSSFLLPHSDTSASLLSSSPAPVNHLTASAIEHSPSPASTLRIATRDTKCLLR